jgi:hypothetical protein
MQVFLMVVITLCFGIYVAISNALAAPFSFCGVCDNVKLVQKQTQPNKLEFYCPPATTPFLTYDNCPNAKAKKTNGVINITCGNGQVMTPVSTKKP